MLVIHDRQKVVLNLREPQRVLSIIPSAKEIGFEGRRLVAVPHHLDETKVLRNLGITVPSPILHYYDWPAATGVKPFEAQRDTSAFLTLNRRAYVLSQMGTGKTLASLWASDYLMSTGQVRKVCILSPLSTLERVWGDEIFKHLPHRTYTVLHHANRKRRLALLDEDSDFYVINHDGMKVMQHALMARDDIDLYIIDELSVLRNAGTDRWKATNAVINGKKPKWVWGLTGTPIPNDPTDAWAQCRLVTPETVTPYFTRFRSATMRQITSYKWVPRDDALTTVQKAMTPSIRFTRDDCFDLPPAMYETRQADMDVSQAKVYKTMLEKLHVAYEDGVITAANEGVKLSKLLQIASGIIYKPDGGVIAIPTQPRIDVLIESIEAAGTKVIVFAIFTETLLMLERILSQRWTVGVVDGSVSKHAKNKTLADFQRSKHPHILLAHPRTTSHGLTLTEASTIIWYTPTLSNEQYEQANDRIQRSGQKNQPYIIHIENCSAERRVYARLRNRQSTQGVLLEMMNGTHES